MTIDFVPKTFQNLIPYLVLENAPRFLAWLRETFDVETIQEEFQGDALLHGAFRVNGTVIEVSSANPEYKAQTVSIHIYVQNCDQIFESAIRAGATEIQAVSEMPYGERSGGLLDPEGNSWWIATQQRDMYPEYKPQ
ncbi:MAG: VOC family protein [Pyrinomonadaceae bacterium]